MNNEHQQGRMPWISIVLALLAIGSLLLGESQTMLSGIGSIHRLLPLLLALPFIVFCLGLTRYFTNLDQAMRDKGVHLMLWSLLAVVVMIGLWGYLNLTQRTFQISSSPSQPIIPRAPQIDTFERGASSAAPALERFSDMARMESSAASQRMMPPQYGGGEVPATDTREFLKTDYNATLQTREVQSLTRSVETIVRGHDGRVDQTSSSEKSGSVRFIVPASEFDDFRTEIEGLVDSRFLSISVQSQNLLSQKRNIEATQEVVEKSLATLTAERKSLVSRHNSALASLQSQIDDNALESSLLSAESTTDPLRQSQIANRLYVLANELLGLTSRLANENSSYSYSIKSYDAQIANANANLSSVKKQDQDLLDTVATVRGTISLRWISYTEIAQMYLPGFWIPGIFMALALLTFFFERRPHLFRKV